ncbi:MAG: glycine cleavage system protein GcvH [Phycisphaerales bacterium]|nr:glycine cleavage system protein GcvH [Phycisphaerales bacterium]
MGTPTDRLYTESHEWHKIDGDILTIGLTTYAVDQLTDVTFVEMREVGTEIEPGESVGEVESVKTTSDIYSQAGGEITEVNEALADNPELVNNDPYGDGWLVKLKIIDKGNLDDCIDADSYDESIR